MKVMTVSPNEGIDLSIAFYSDILNKIHGPISHLPNAVSQALAYCMRVSDC